MCINHSDKRQNTAEIWSSGTDWGQQLFSGTQIIICGWNSWRIPQSEVTILLTFSNSRSNLHKIVQMQNMKTARWTTQSKSTVWCRLKNQAVETKDKAEWSKKEWEKYTSFRRFWNMLLFDSVWKREGEESIGRETGSQTDRGSVGWQRPNENCSWKWKC